MPATITGRGGQVVLTGQVRRAARGAAGTSLVENSRIKTDLEFLGSISAGYSHDGRTSTGGPAHDVAVLAPETELDAALGTPGGPFLPLTGGTVTGDTGFNTSLTIGVSNKAYSGATWQSQFWLNTGLVGSTAATGLTNVHQVTINGDTMDASGSALTLVNYSAVNANFGGATMKGNRQGFGANINLSAASGNPRGGFYVGIVGEASASSADNGTGLTPATFGGSVWGGNFYARVAGAARNFGGVIGIEVNPAIDTGATACSLVGIQVIPTSSHLIRGALGWDIGYLMTESAGAQQIDIGYCVGTSNGGGQWPIRNDGALFRAAMGYTGGASAYHGIQIAEVSFPPFGGGVRGGAFVSNGFAVDGGGAIQCGTGYLLPSGGLTIDVKGSVGTGVPTVAAGGAGYSVNDVIYDYFGGVYIVSAVSAGAVTSVTVRTGLYGESHQPWYSSHTTPANPLSTTTWSNSPNAGRGCTLNVTWNTTLTDLQIQPSGGLTHIGGPSQQVTVSQSGGFNFVQGVGGGLILDAPGPIALGWGGATIIDLNTATKFASTVGFNNTNPIAKPAGWGAATGTATRTTFLTSSVTLATLAEHVKALIDDLTAYGLIGP